MKLFSLLTARRSVLLVLVTFFCSDSLTARQSAEEKSFVPQIPAAIILDLDTNVKSAALDLLSRTAYSSTPGEYRVAFATLQDALDAHEKLIALHMSEEETDQTLSTTKPQKTKALKKELNSDIPTAAGIQIPDMPKQPEVANPTPAKSIPPLPELPAAPAQPEVKLPEAPQQPAPTLPALPAISTAPAAMLPTPPAEPAQPAAVPALPMPPAPQ